MRLLTIILVLFTSQLSAQFNTIDGKTFRRLSEFAMPTKNFGADTVKSISITDTSRSSGLLLLSKDTTAMYVYDDTMNMFTTASTWNFTPALPCCLPDTLPLNYVNIVNCQPNRNEFLIVRPNNTITTTECDTIQYLYVDTIAYGVNNKYKVYTALLNTFTSDTVNVTVLENTIGNVTVTRSGSGFFDFNCTSCFPNNKTFLLATNPNDDQTFISMIYKLSNSWVQLFTYEYAGPGNDNVQNCSIEIRVYK